MHRVLRLATPLGLIWFCGACAVAGVQGALLASKPQHEPMVEHVLRVTASNPFSSPAWLVVSTKGDLEVPTSLSWNAIEFRDLESGLACVAVHGEHSVVLYPIPPGASVVVERHSEVLNRSVRFVGVCVAETASVDGLGDLTKLLSDAVPSWKGPHGTSVVVSSNRAFLQRPVVLANERTDTFVSLKIAAASSLPLGSRQ